MARILLVDDEKVARTLYGDFLSAAAHEVTTVASAAEAKEALTRASYDVLVTDLILPETDGMELLRHTKETHPDVEVIVITALDKVDPAVRAIKSGAAEYLVKPVAPEALTHAVTKALTARRLLRENASLREYVSLLEMGQRIATTLDRDKLLHSAATAFGQVMSSPATLVFTRSGNEFVCAHVSGLLENASVVDTLTARLREVPRGADPVKISELPGALPYAVIFPASEGGQTWGFAVTLSENLSETQRMDRAVYLSGQLGLALKNLGRFAAVEDLAYLDDLTHLFNLRYLQLILERETRSAEQTGTPFSLLFLDLDYFKSVNDTHGHVVGSKLLVEVAKVLKGCVRDNDVVVRYGGDEYVILLRGTDSGGALKVAERIRRTTEEHHFLAREGYALSVTTCIGVASFPEHATDKGTLLDYADRAMYRGKKSTRNIVYMAAKGLEATPPSRHSTPTG